MGNTYYRVTVVNYEIIIEWEERKEKFPIEDLIIVYMFKSPPMITFRFVYLEKSLFFYLEVKNEADMRGAAGLLKDLSVCVHRYGLKLEF
jgi:hypothetical protein